MSPWDRIITCVVALFLASACSTDTATEPAPQTESASAPSTSSVEPEQTLRTEDTPVAQSEASCEPESIHVLVNKHHGLEIEDFEPSDLVDLEVPQQYGGQQLREEAGSALEELIAAAADDGIKLWVTTAYREVEHQRALYEQRFAELGQDATDELTARPGYSEHQTGLAVDMSFEGNHDCNLRTCFADTEQGQWLAEHAAQFGFIIRYPEGAEAITGYSYEPWHLRYVGEPTAIDVTEQGITLEEYWDQPPAPDYQEDNR